METGKEYIRTDLASECTLEKTYEKSHGIDYGEYDKDGITVQTLKITTVEGAGIIGKPIGTYVTLNVGKIWLADDDRFNKTAAVLSGEIRRFAAALAPDYKSVLIVGLGNRFITSDAVGPLSVKEVTVTRHIKEIDSPLFEKIGMYDLSAVAPGVIGQTGIETLELIRGAKENVRPSLIIVIDALASRSVDRLATTIQLSDTGISPGSGIGNKRKAINSEELGVPVLAIGVPTVVDSSTLVYDMLQNAGIEEVNDKLKTELDNGRSFFVTLKDSDIAITELSRLISSSLNLAFSIE